MINNVFIITALRRDYINKCLSSLYEYTPNLNFKVILVDQTKDGLGDLPGVHLKLRPHRNLGFAKAMNEGIIHALHWGSEYITCWNDDVECINKRWWDGLMGTFHMESTKEILAVNPESPKIPLWGYGNTHGDYVELVSYERAHTEEGYDYLLKGDLRDLRARYPDLPKTFPENYNGVCDGIAAWGPVCKPKLFKEIGLWDERFYPGGGEDYCMMCRVYSAGYRAVSSRQSYVWHAWGKSKDHLSEITDQAMPIETKRCWQDLTYLFPPELNEGNKMDIWGEYDGKDGTRKKFIRRPEIGVVEI